MIKSIIFDFDGVLVLSEKPRFKVIQNSAANNNISIADEAIKKMVGRTTIKFLNDVLKEDEKPLIDKIVDEYENEYKGNITKYVEPIDFAVNFVKNYNGSLYLALASMSSRRVIEELTKHFNIYSNFKVIVCKEDVANHKPNPEIYLKTAEELAASSNECIVIEDTVVGTQAALNAGMKCFVLLNGFNNKEEFSDVNIEGFITSREDLDKLTKQEVNIFEK